LRTIEYRLPYGPRRGEARPAVIVNQTGDLYNLIVFTDGAFDGLESQPGLYHAVGVELSIEPLPNTFRYVTTDAPAPGPTAMWVKNLRVDESKSEIEGSELTTPENSTNENPPAE
jgi:hypothetical protein